MDASPRQLLAVTHGSGMTTDAMLQSVHLAEPLVAMLQSMLHETPKMKPFRCKLQFYIRIAMLQSVHLAGPLVAMLQSMLHD